MECGGACGDGQAEGIGDCFEARGSESRMRMLERHRHLCFMQFNIHSQFYPQKCGCCGCGGYCDAFAPSRVETRGDSLNDQAAIQHATRK